MCHIRVFFPCRANKTNNIHKTAYDASDILSGNASDRFWSDKGNEILE